MRRSGKIPMKVRAFSLSDEQYELVKRVARVARESNMSNSVLIRSLVEELREAEEEANGR